VVDAGHPADVPIPGQPFTFGTLIDAQALGDLRSLRERGRRVARVTLEQLMEVA
jgi:glucose-6-phosphate isomerase